MTRISELKEKVRPAIGAILVPEVDAVLAALDELAGLAERGEHADRLEDALGVAYDLLRDDGYDHDPDYTQEWKTIHTALLGEKQ